MSGAIVAASIGAVAAVGGGVIAAHGASKAANAQVSSANRAADLQHQDATAALNYQKQQDALRQKNMQPWLTAGQGAITNLYSQMNNGGFPEWTGSFQAPTGITEQNDPGFQSRLKLGQQALERGAASRGGLLTGGTARMENQYAQDYASNEYGNVYGRAWNEYQQKYNEAMNSNTNRFNRLAAVSGVGQTTAGQLGQLGQQSANTVSNIYATEGQQVGNSIMAAGNARASGYINSANAYNSGLNGIAQSALLYSMLKAPTATSGIPSGGYNVNYDTMWGGG